jgi:hypothetical protein
VAIPVEVKDPVAKRAPSKKIKDPVQRNFINSKHGEMYAKYRDMFADLFKDAKSDGVVDYISKLRRYEDPGTDLETMFFSKLPSKTRDMLDRVKDTLASWQSDTRLTKAMTIKARYAQLEGGNIEDLIIKREGDFEYLMDMLDSILSEEDYILMRAMSQAYLKARKKGRVTLYRGTDGRTGRQIRAEVIDQVERGRTEVNIRNDILTGWTSLKSVADGFGRKAGGITIKESILVKDIVVYEDMLCGWNKSYVRERESIVVSGPDDIYETKRISYE